MEYDPCAGCDEIPVYKVQSTEPVKHYREEFGGSGFRLVMIPPDIREKDASGGCGGYC